MLKLKNSFGMAKLVTNYSNHNYNSLVCGMIPKSIKTFVHEVLFCKNYKFVTAVNKYGSDLKHRNFLPLAIHFY